MKIEQVQKLQQKLILSPQMQQAIHLLQLPLTELRQTAAQEIMKNPLLEEVPDSEIEKGMDDSLETPLSETTESKQESQAAAREQDFETQDAQPDAPHETSKESKDVFEDFQDEFNKLTQLDDEWRDYFRQAATFRKSSPEDEDKRQYFESSITSEETLEEHLKEQLHLNTQNEEKQRIGENIIGNLDDNGFLHLPLEEIAQATNTTLEQVEESLKLIQTFHPVGVGSRTIQECLLIQLERLGRKNSLAAKIVEHHLDLLAKKKIPQIAKSIGTTIDAVKSATQEIEQLEPKPGRMFSHSDNFYPIPDVVIKKNEDEEYEVILNNDKIPHLRISHLYRQLMHQQDDPKIKEYVQSKVKAGLWFIKNIQQRQNTICNIAKELVRVQKDFLDKGPHYLRPLTMQQVADVIEVHESTVSRAIANKYIQTPQGLFQFKYFFTGGLNTTSGENASTTTVKEKILDLVSHEDKKKPLADQTIIEILDREGIQLARRTVAKYRKELKILPSHLRKEY